MNMALLIGRLGGDPEIRTLNSGDKVANFSLATEERWKDRTSGEKRSRTTWHRIVTFVPGTVKFLEDYVGKGDLVQVVGVIRNEDWQDQQGQKRQVTKIGVSGPAHRIEKLAGVRTSDDDPPSGTGDQSGFSPDLDDEIPF